MPQDGILFILRRKTENLPLVRQEGEKEDGSGLNCSQIMPFHIRGSREHLNEYLSKEQICMRSALQLLSDDTFQPGISPSGARGCQSSVHFAVKRKQREGEFLRGIVHTAVVGCS